MKEENIFPIQADTDLNVLEDLVLPSKTEKEIKKEDKVPKTSNEVRNKKDKSKEAETRSLE